MPLLLLAQLAAPSTQSSPIRLPELRPALERPDSPGQRQAPTIQTDPSETAPPPVPADPLPPSPGKGDAPLHGPDHHSRTPVPIQGQTPYTNTQLQQILGPCARVSDPQQRLTACAAALTARLVADGYVNSRVYALSKADTQALEVVEGRIVELEVSGPEGRQLSRITRLLSHLKGKVLHLPSLERELRLLRITPGVKSVKASLSRLGSDPSQARVTVNVKTGAPRWQGDLAVRNDGSSGTGEFRSSATFVKPGVGTIDDLLLIYGEVSGNDAPNAGQLIGSASYTFPLGPSLNFTAAFGSSRSEIVDGLPPGAAVPTSRQIQGLGQLEWVLKDRLTHRFALFAGLSGNTLQNFANNQPVGELTSGYVRYGVNASGIRNSVIWGANAYLMNAVPSITPLDQRRLLEAPPGGFRLGRSMGAGGLLSASWAVAPAVQLTGRLAGQLGFNQLLPSMQFTLGSDAGLRGLPGQLISGDNGWLSTVEAAWTVWKNKANAIQVVPFAGAGGVTQQNPLGDVSDTVGSYGLLLRWLAGSNWIVELGGIDQVSTANNPGPWVNSLLGSGLYAKVQYRF
ncbi:MAG: ShlB/FhaC/HecB family hemolysin secretion/activation protein [Cyanobium sp.]